METSLTGKALDFGSNEYGFESRVSKTMNSRRYLEFIIKYNTCVKKKKNSFTLSYAQANYQIAQLFERDQRAPLGLEGVASNLQGPHALKTGPEATIVSVQRQREHLTGYFRGDIKDRVIKLGDIHAKRFVELGPRVISDIHGGVNREEKEADPQLVEAAEQFRVGSHDQCKSLAVSKLVVTPFQKPFKLSLIHI